MDWIEAPITIGRTQLTFAQSMAVRVAVGGMLMQLDDPEHIEALGDIGPLYVERLSEVQQLLIENAEDERDWARPALHETIVNTTPKD